VVLEPVDPNARFRERRARARRRRKLRRTSFLLALVVSAVVGGVLAVRVFNPSESNPAGVKAAQTSKTTSGPAESKVPAEIRGIHLTMGLASLPGKMDEYAALRDKGLNTIALDVKDENGAVAFASPEAPLASEIGATTSDFYDPSVVAAQLHDQGIYLIGRIVVFEDPVLSARRPDLAILRSDGSRWLTSGGLGWVNEYDKRVWDYNISIAKAAVKAGFDEIQFDYVRFPSDGDVSSAVYPGKRNEQMGTTIARFLSYATAQLHPLGARVSVDVFGLSATRDMGIGQLPKRMARYVDAISPMVYPSHFGSGEYGLPDPEANPGITVGYALSDFTARMRGRRAELVPWIQDFSLQRTFSRSDVEDQILAVRRSGARGYLLWNPNGVYTPGMLAPAGDRVTYSR
jgi:hypothetical protein